MRARSALFDLYGDHLRAHGSVAPVAALVELLAPLDIKPPAVRTAISRMVKQGWLTALVCDGQRGYMLSDKAKKRIDDTAARIYRTEDRVWNGEFDMVMFKTSPARREKDQLLDALRFHGYGQINTTTWISPWQSTELDAIFNEAGIEYDRYSATHHGDSSALVDRAWNLTELAKRYHEFMVDMENVVGQIRIGTPDEDAFGARLRLVHSFRVFLFSDPQLPAQLLPPNWEGNTAAAYFDAQAARLRPAADRFVHECLLGK